MEQGWIDLERGTGHRNDRPRGFKVRIDGQVVGLINQSQTLAFPVAPGVHDVRLNLDWWKSPILRVDVPAGARVRLRCSPASRTRYFSLTRLNGYIELEQV